MRITNNMMVSTLLSNLTRSMNKMSRYQDQEATGKSIINASDDPIGTSKILKYKSDIAALNQYEKNTGDSLSWLEVTESSIADTGDVLQRMRELAVQAANGTNTVEETSKIAVEIKQLKGQLITNGNFSYAGRYAFSGYQTDIPLFNEDGTYRIDVTQRDLDNKPKLEYQVSIAQNMDVTTHGLDVFGAILNPPDLLETNLPNGSATGTAAAKSYLMGAFDLTQDYTAVNLDITVGIVNYDVDASTLVGTVADPLTQNEVLDHYNNAVNGLGDKLSAVADVFFDASGKLVIKAKAFGPVALVQGSALFTTDFTGNNVTEATINSAVTMLDADAATNEALLKTGVFYLTIDGERKRIAIDTTVPPGNAPFTTVANWVGALQVSVDQAFGAGKVQVNGSSATPISFATLNTTEGKTPVIEAEYIQATESELIHDVNEFIDGLETNNLTKINAFLTQVDPHLNRVLSLRADIGARVNRMELVVNRIAENTTSYTKMLSDVQDVDMAGVIMFLKNAENVYKAALGTGSKVIQPSLIDFLT